MKLQKVKINNFRSIKEQEISFDLFCRILVGLIESGKSNILKAMRLLDPAEKVEKEDLREISADEPQIKEAAVRFYFDLDKNDSSEIYQKVLSEIGGISENALIIEQAGKKMTLRDYCFSRKQGIYFVNILDGQKSPRYLADVTSKLIVGDLRLPTEKTPNVQVSNGRGENTNVRELTIVQIVEPAFAALTELIPVKMEDLAELVGSKIIEYVKENLPTVIYWKYKDEYLLPNKIEIDQFAIKNESCLPLKHMFQLAQVEDIKAAITQAKGTPKGMKNLLARVAKQATAHFRAVWPEYRNIEFELVPDGNHIDAGVKDVHNTFSFNQRSDGFKRFVAFLLMVSSIVKTGKMNNAVLLVDEPDVSLNPSGAKYLKNELLKIAKTNTVAFSTHSIFMVDADCVERHVIVTKEKEITFCEDARESNILDQEVLYNALGYSIFESLKKTNLLFEGWRDKKLFLIAMSKVPTAYKETKERLNNLGACHAKGVKDIGNITPLLELADRTCFVLSDADAAAKDKKKKYQNEGGYGKWWTYDDVWPGVPAVTGEDFVKSHVFLDLLTQIKETRNLVNLPENLDDPRGKIYIITKWLTENGVPGNEISKTLEEIKEKVFSNLRQAEISDTYYEFLEKLAEKISVESGDSA